MLIMTANSHKPTKIAYSYVRFSSSEQRKGNSLARQMEWTKSLCQRNGWMLDTSLNFHDLGRSGYRPGEQGALKRFLQAIEEGRVKPGSVLIIEHLDRLSRGDVLDAMNLLNGILKAGVEVATSQDNRLYTDLATISDLMQPIVSFALAHEESQKKSTRATDNWERKRSWALQRGVPMTTKVPAWLTIERLNEQPMRFVLDSKKAQIIRQIFRYAISGMGARVICARLNREGIENIASQSKKGARKTWNLRYVEALLANRSLLGEFQPCRLIDKKRVPTGPVIPDYYPRVISDDEFYTAQAGRHARKAKRGNPGNCVPNLFSGILYDARTGDTMRLFNASADERRAGTSRRLASYGASLGIPGTKFLSWKYESLEDAFLSCVNGISKLNVHEQHGQANRLVAISERLVQVEDKISKVQCRIADEPDCEAFLAVLSQLDKERKSLRVELEDEKARVKGEEQDAQQEFRTVMDLLAATDSPEAVAELRSRLRTAVREIVAEVWVLINVHSTQCRSCDVQVFLKNGRVQEFTITRIGRVFSTICARHLSDFSKEPPVVALRAESMPQNQNARSAFIAFERLGEILECCPWMDLRQWRHRVASGQHVFYGVQDSEAIA